MTNPYKAPERDTKIFTLPSCGSVALYGPEMRVIRTRAFQRLGNIKQLGTAHVVFRGAVHTRFEHSLGTVYWAERIVQSVQKNPRTAERVSERAHRVIRMAALLHDITHVPFGHTLEDELGLVERHDRNRARFDRLVLESDIGSILREVLDDEDFQELLRVLAVSKDEQIADLRDPYVGDIIANTVCADLLDYVQRDLGACGMPVALGDRFLDFFTITPDSALSKADRRRMALNLEKRGMPRPDVESEVIKLLSYRYELFERVYFHHGKNAASVMIGRAVQESGLVGTDGNDDVLDSMSDELLLHCLARPDLVEHLELLTARHGPGDLNLAADLAQAVLDRRLYKIAYLGVRDDLEEDADDLHAAHARPDERRALERRFARRGGLKDGQVLLHLPDPDMALKLADVRVLTHRKRVITLKEWDERHSHRAHAVSEAHKHLWRVTVYVHPEASADAKARVRADAQDVFGAPSRYVREPETSGYVRTLFEQRAAEKGWTYADLAALEKMAALEDTVDPDAAVEQMDARIKDFRSRS